MQKIFNKSFLKILFVFSLIFISANMCHAAITVNVTADSQSIISGRTTIIRWNSSGATSCTPPAGYESAGTGTSGSFTTNVLTATTTFSVTCVSSVPTTIACYDGFYELGDTVHPNGGSITYTLASGYQDTINGVFSGYPISIEYKTGTPITKIGMGTVACSSGSCGGTVAGSIQCSGMSSPGPYEGQSCSQFKTKASCESSGCNRWQTHGCNWNVKAI